jgi:hypothetical protein
MAIRLLRQADSKLNKEILEDSSCLNPVSLGLADSPRISKKNINSDKCKQSYREVFIQLNTGKSLTFSTTDECSVDYLSNLNSAHRLTRRKLCIVYFFNAQVSSPGYPVFVYQIKDLISSGLFAQHLFAPVEFWIVLTATKTQQQEIVKIYKNLVRSHEGKKNTIFSQTKITTTNDNQYELPALNLLWHLAREPGHKESIFLYFHGKGTSHRESEQSRNFRELFLTRLVVGSWLTSYILFELLKEIEKVGFMSSPGGWLWYNFWWARSSYLRGLSRPQISDNRHGYESWLGMKNTPLSEQPTLSTSSTEFALISNPAKAIYNMGSPVDAKAASEMCKLGYIATSKSFS